MGNRRKSTETKILEGTFRPDRAPADEPKPSGTAECPDFLSAEAQTEWARLAPELEACGLLTSVDMAVFAGYCQAWSDFRNLTNLLNGMASWTWESQTGYRQVCPEVGMRKEASVRMAQAAAKLGLSPADRSGLNVGFSVAKRKNKFARRGKPKNEFSDLGNLTG